MKGTVNKNLRRVIAIAVALSAVALLFVYYHFDPSGDMAGKWFPKCIVKTLTGWQCPSCGVQRALHALMHGEVGRSLSYNWFLAFSLLYLAGMWIGELTRNRYPSIRRFFWGEKGGILYVAVYVGWFIMRNILGI